MIPFYFMRRRRRAFNARRRFQQLRAVVTRFLALAMLMAVLHVVAMIAFEHLSVRDAVWLTATTLVTVGYGDLAAKTAFGQLATMLLLYAAGIFLAAQAASAWFDYRAERREAMRHGEWDLSGEVKGHVVIVAPGRVAERYLINLVAEFDHHQATRDSEVVIVSDEFPDGLPGALAAADVKLVSGFAHDAEALDRAAVARCGYVIALADDPDASLSDSVTFDVVSRIREANKTCPVIAQCVDDRNRPRLLAASANAVLRAGRAYSELLVTSLLNPGVIAVLENLFSAAGERLTLVNGSFRGTWCNLVRETLERGAGLPIAVRMADGQVVTAPSPQHSIDAVGLYVLVSASEA
jgi:voltage-gated potassium channel